MLSKRHRMLMSVCFLLVFVTFLIRYCLPRFVQRLLKIRKELFTHIGTVVSRVNFSAFSRHCRPSTSHPRTKSAVITLYAIFSGGRRDVFRSYRSTMRPCICKSNCCAANNFTERPFFPLSLSQLCNFENFPRSRHLYFLISSHHLSKIVIIRFLCFFFSLLRNKLDYEQITT